MTPQLIDNLTEKAVQSILKGCVELCHSHLVHTSGEKGLARVGLFYFPADGVYIVREHYNSQAETEYEGTDLTEAVKKYNEISDSHEATRWPARSGVRQGPPVKDESEHFMNCMTCGQSFDMRDLSQLMYHEKPQHLPKQVN